MNYVEIFITSYNYGHYIERAVQSVVQQTSDRWRLIIYDNGSTDKTYDVVSRYLSDNRVSWVQHPKNIGHIRNILNGFCRAQGAYVATLQADDFLDPMFVERAVNVLDEDQSTPYVFFDWCSYIEEDASSCRNPYTPMVQGESGAKYVSPLLEFSNFVPLHLIVFRKECMEYFDRWFDGGMFAQLGEQFILKLIESRYGPGFYVSEIGGYWRRHKNQLTSFHSDNGTYHIENVAEPLLCLSALDELRPEFRYACLLALLRKGADRCYIEIDRWLDSPAGRVVARKVASLDEASMQAGRRVFLVAMLKWRVFGGVAQKDEDTLEAWLQRVGYVSARQLGAFLDSMQQDYGPALLSEREASLLLARIGESPLSSKAASADPKSPLTLSLDKYEAWLFCQQMRNGEAAALERRIATSWRTHPIFTLLVSCDSVEFPWLADFLDSVAAQHYPHWRLVVLSDADAPDPMFDGGQLVWHGGVDLADGAELGRLCDHYLAETPDGWCALLPAACRLAPEALLLCADYLNRFQDKQAFYFDHDRVAVDGARCEPSLKPGFDLDFLYANDYIGSAVVFANRALQGAGGCGSAGAWAPLDALLRLCEQGAAARIGHIDRVLLSLAENYRVPAEVDARARATVCQSHFNRRGIEAKVLPGLLDGTLRVDYLHATTPLVSIIIPNKDKVEYLQPCVDSLIDKTDWPNWELLIVDNGSEEPETLEYYEVLQERLGSRLRLLSYPQSFNFSAQCNMGVEAAAGEYMLLLNNDTQIIQPKWLSRMMAHGQRPDVGAVGCRLVFPETGNIQHAGIAFSFASEVEAMPGHQYLNAEGDTPGYLNGLWCEQAMPAVTAACLLTRKQVYQAVGGFDAENLAVLHGDVDFGLKLNRAGYRVLYTPFATLVHHGSTSIKADSAAQVERMLKNAVRSAAERRYILKTWLPEMAADRHLSRHLVCNGSKIALQQTLPVPWDVHFHDCPRIYGFADGGGSGKYRVGQPLAMLQEQGRLAAMFALSSPVTPLPDLITARRMAADVFLLQTPVTNRHFEALTAYREHLPELRCIASLDDLLTAIPEESNVYKDWQRGFRDVRSRLRKGLALCDRLIVSTETLREFCAPLIEDIRVVPNRLRRQDWDGLTSLRAQGHKPRVGWVGALQHAGDLAIIRDVVRALQHEVEWVFMGMWPDGLEDISMERHAAVPFEEYPRKVASLNLDIALAPLASNDFNRCKSNLRLLEYGALAWPVVCSDIDPYRSNHAPVTRVPEDAQAWVDAIRTLAQDPARAEHEGQLLRAWVDRDYWLDDHWQEWEKALLD